MTVATPDLNQIARAIWDVMLDLELAPAPAGAVHGEALTGCVQITGDWEGAVTVQVGLGLGVRATALMLGVEPVEVEEDDVGDAVGELTNMVGGNVKAALVGDCQLSLPSVTRGTNYRVSVPGSFVLEEAVLACDGDQVVVTLLGRR